MPRYKTAAQYKYGAEAVANLRASIVSDKEELALLQGKTNAMALAVAESEDPKEREAYKAHQQAVADLAEKLDISERALDAAIVRSRTESERRVFNEQTKQVGRVGKILDDMEAETAVMQEACITLAKSYLKVQELSGRVANAFLGGPTALPVGHGLGGNDLSRLVAEEFARLSSGEHMGMPMREWPYTALPGSNSPGIFTNAVPKPVSEALAERNAWLKRVMSNYLAALKPDHVK
jgi:hypothetical protein